MTDNDIYDLEVRHRYANIRVDETWTKARKLFKNGYGAELYTDQTICWLYVVQAAAEIETIGSKYHETTAGGVAGAWGLNIDGKLYASDRHLDRSRTFWVFVTAIKNPQRTPASSIGHAFIYRNNVLLASADLSVAQQSASLDIPKTAPPIVLRGDLPPINPVPIQSEIDKAARYDDLAPAGEFVIRLSCSSRNEPNIEASISAGDEEPVVRSCNEGDQNAEVRRREVVRGKRKARERATIQYIIPQDPKIENNGGSIDWSINYVYKGVKCSIAGDSVRNDRLRTHGCRSTQDKKIVCTWKVPLEKKRYCD